MRTILFCVALMSIAAPATELEQQVTLPPIELSSDTSVESALQRRRSVRTFSEESIALEDVGQLLWAAQGITRRNGFRTAPSAGALFPIEMYVVAGDVDELSPGVYRYEPEKHELRLVVDGDRRKALASACWFQKWVRRAPAALVVTGVYERTAKKYGDRSERYVHIEVGAVAQNIYLQATSRGLGTVIVGAFRDAKVKAVLELPTDHEPLAVMPVGRP